MQALVKHVLTGKLKTHRIGDIAIRRNPMLYGSISEQLRMLESSGLTERREWTSSRVREVLTVAARSAYGRRVGAGTELQEWPLLDKSSVRNDPRAFLANRAIMAAHASTGGTTGMPLKLTRPLSSIVFEQVCLDKMHHNLGLSVRSARVAVLRGDNIKDIFDDQPPFWLNTSAGKRLVFSSNHLGADTVTAYAQALEEFRPDVLCAYPTALESLCILLRRTRIKLSIRRVLTSSEVMPAQVWQLARDVLGSEVLDYYGQAERVAFAYARQTQEYRFLPGYGYVELHPAGEDDGQVLYEIVATNLWNFAMPLPRYRTGDLVKLPASWGACELEQVALGMRAFPGILGRDSDILISPDGALLTGIDHFQRGVERVVRIQVIQEAPDAVRILVLPAAGYSEEDDEHLLRNARAKLPPSMRVHLERVKTLERTAAGKTPFVIHRPTVEELLRVIRDRGVRP